MTFLVDPTSRKAKTTTILTAMVAATASSATSLFSSAEALSDTCSTVNRNSYQARISKLATQIQPRVLVSTRGSGNYGESGTASFYTIDKLPKITTAEPAVGSDESSTSTSNGEQQLERTDIDLGPNRLAFFIDNVLSADEADALAACAEAILEDNGHSRMAPGIQTPPGMRINEAAHWYPSQSLASDFLKKIYDRIEPFVPEQMEDDDSLTLYPKLSEKIAQFKYNQGDQFNRHIDGLFPGQGINTGGTGVDEWVGVVSGMSMLFYLNDQEHDGLLGGETRLWSADGSRHVDITPKKGRVLFFRRGSPNAVLHAGLPVTSEVPKFMALINLAYGKQTGKRPLMQ